MEFPNSLEGKVKDAVNIVVSDEKIQEEYLQNQEKLKEIENAETNLKNDIINLQDSIENETETEEKVKRKREELLKLEKSKEATLSSNFNQLKDQLTIEFNRTMSILNQEDFDSFAETIVNARRIFCIGSGSSYMVVADFNRKLKLVDLWANDYFELYSIQRIPEISTDKDVIITFSLGGASKEINESILSAKQNGTKVLAVTSLTASPLAKISDQVINIYDAPKARKKIRSRLMLNVVAIILFEIIVSKLNNK